ncbi:amidohydrolase [Dactylosporangium sp. CA-233914]|uniref:amidohydrolase n=1 Tax=Dactylosporangium sp. CA-233914 TaxID=3239934 RepID=UPI003D8D4635
MNPASDLRAAVDAAAAHVRALRRDLHRHPELGWSEYYTTARLRDELHAVGITDIIAGTDLYRGATRLGVPDATVLAAAAGAAGVSEADLATMRAGTGLITTLDSGRPGPVVTLRADIDALPIDESTDPDHTPHAGGYRSSRAGIMHACGHDAHAAVVAGVARVLRDLGAPRRGAVQFIFQPAEEGTRGADAIVQAGWLDRTDYFLGLHNAARPWFGTGHLCPGVHGLLATTKIDIHIRGREAHFGLAPHLGRSAVDAASAIALLAHAIPRRPGGSGLTNIGRIDSGRARNVVPGEALLLAEVRADRNEDADALLAGMHRLVEGIAHAFDVTATVEVVGRSPAADSDRELATLVGEVAAEQPGITVHDTMAYEASDDAAAMMRRVQERGGQATYLHIGSHLPGTTHTPRFDVDEASLPPAVTVLAGTVLRLTAAP